MLCNSCHCKTYRLKRKATGLTAEGAMAKLRARHTAALAAAGAGAAGQRPAAAGRTAGAAAGVARRGSPPSGTQAAAAATPGSAGGSWQQQLPGDGKLAKHHQHLQRKQQQEGPSTPVQEATDLPVLLFHSHQPLLADIQRRALEEVGGGAAEVARTLLCAGRAQMATPGAVQRVVLGVLPRVYLQLPDEPPGILHTASCLVEAVAPFAHQAEQAADSGDQAGGPLGSAAQPGGSRTSGAAGAMPPPPPSIRLTVFAAAGAVACWHEAPPEPSRPLSFNSSTKRPVWSSGAEGGPGFSLLFPGPYCPQLDLFTSIHQHVAAMGHAVMQQPVLSVLGPQHMAAATNLKHAFPSPLRLLAQPAADGTAAEAAAEHLAMGGPCLLDEASLPARGLSGLALAEPGASGALHLPLPLPTLSINPMPSGALFDTPSMQEGGYATGHLLQFLF